MSGAAAAAAVNQQIYSAACFWPDGQAQAALINPRLHKTHTQHSFTTLATPPNKHPSIISHNAPKQSFQMHFKKSNTVKLWLNQ